jgi:elongation factor Ts
MDWLREHGAAKAAYKVQGRETSEGLVALSVSEDGKSAAIVKVASETDFASRSSKFVELVLNVAAATKQSPCDGQIDEVLTLTSSDGKTVKDLLDEAIVAIRENLSVPKAVKLQAQHGILVGYVHNRVDSSMAGTAAALVEVKPLKGTNTSEDTLREAGKKLAMHIVAARPQYLSLGDIPEEVLEREREILTKQQELLPFPKSPEIVDKVVGGKIRKFSEGICLLEQGHMIEEKNPKVSKVLQNLGISVERFESMSIT